LTKNRFPKLSRYFQHSVIWDANAMLKQGVYQLPLFCLCIQEKTLVSMIEHGPDIKFQIENGLAKSDFAIAQLLYFNSHTKWTKNTSEHSRHSTSRPLWNGFSSGIFNSNLFFRRVLLNVELVSNWLSLDSYKLHRWASLNTTPPMPPTRLHQCAQNLQDQKLLATLSAGDVVAQELKYHGACLTSLHNKERAHLRMKPYASALCFHYVGH
jgi:hypothetical protein